LVALAFKLEESQYGQLTYFRIYQGTLKKGSFIFNRTSGDGNKIKVPRIVRMHADNMEEISEAAAGDVVAVFGVECASMDTFTEAPINWSLTSMFVPNPVMSIAIKPKSTEQQDVFAKAMGKFTKEDPTLRINIDDRTGETILSGMGELHLEVYVERMRREFNLDTTTSPPAVNYMETISTKVPFDYLHKKQSGGQGQYGRVIGYIEPNPEEDDVIFANHIVGTNIPPEYIPSIERGVQEIAKEGVLVDCPLTRMRVVLTDGAYHAVDSSDLAFRTAIVQAIREAIRKSSTGLVMEPIMKVEISCPTDFQGPVIGGLTRNRGSIASSESNADGSMCTIIAEVPLSQMFGYSSALRSGTEGKGEFSMEYLRHAPLPPNEQTKVIAAHQAEKQANN
jgi:elongation factor G